MINFLIDTVVDIPHLQKCLDELYLTLFNIYSFVNDNQRKHVVFRDGINVRRVPISYRPAKYVKIHSEQLIKQIRNLNVNVLSSSDKNILEHVKNKLANEISHLKNYQNDDEFEFASIILVKNLMRIQNEGINYLMEQINNR